MILSFCQSEQNRIVEVSKITGDAGLCNAKRELYQLSYIPVLFKLRSFWTKSMIYQLSICNELSIPSHYQQTPNRILEAWKSLEMRGIDPRTSRQSERSTISATRFELASEQNPWYISFRFVTSCQFLPIIANTKWILEAWKSFGDAFHAPLACKASAFHFELRSRTLQASS